MAKMLQLQAVVESPYLPERLVYPWPIAKVQPLAMIPLAVDTSPLEIGLVVLQLANYNGVSIAGDAQETILQILSLDSAVLPGGIQARCEENGVISPSCCCGLEYWHQWIDFLDTGHSPWMGHSPWPTLEKQGNLIRICSNKDSIKHFFLETSFDDFKCQLKQVERDLVEFAFCIEAWAQSIDFNIGQELRLKFSEWFGIRSYFEGSEIK